MAPITTAAPAAAPTNTSTTHTHRRGRETETERLRFVGYHQTYPYADEENLRRREKGIFKKDT